MKRRDLLKGMIVAPLVSLTPDEAKKVEAEQQLKGKHQLRGASAASFFTAPASLYRGLGDE